MAKQPATPPAQAKPAQANKGQPATAAVAVPAVQSLTNNTTTNTTNNTTPGALVGTFGVVVRSPGGNVTTCRSKGAQWPNLGGTPTLAVYPCQQGTGGAALGTPHNGGTCFERTFVYAMPNRLWEVLNRLFIRRRVAAESDRALRRLKQVLEAG